MKTNLNTQTDFNGTNQLESDIKAKTRIKNHGAILEKVSEICHKHGGYAEIGEGIFVFDSNKFKIIEK